jgi:hypothetical protein
VARHGGGFVMIGGWHAFGEGGYAKTPFDRMLPVEMNANDTHRDGQDFRWVLTDDGWTHPLMQVEPEAAKNKEAWEKLNTLGGRAFAFGGTDGHDAIVIRQLFQTIRAERRAIGKT